MPNPCVAEIQSLISQGKIEPAIDKFLECSKSNSSLYSSAVLISSQFKQLKRDYNIGVLDRRDYTSSTNKITFSLLRFADELETDDSNPSENSSGKQFSKKPKAFISYNHADKETAYKVQNILETEGIKVTIDTGNDKIGGKLATYITETIQKTDCTVSIVSKKSLLSTWVASETLLTFLHEQVNGGNQFFPCYIDDSFFDPGFIIEMVEKIDEDMAIRNQNREKLAKLNVNASNLTTEIDRLHKLRQNVGDILQRLTSSYSLDIREPVFDQNMKKLVAAIRNTTKA